MSDCHPEALEGYAAGTLGKAEATAVAKHLSACAACAEELRWLERERRLFAARAKAHPAPAPFEAVLAALGEEGAPVAEAIAARAVEAVPARMADSIAPRSFKTGTKRAAKTIAARGRRGKGRARRSMTVPVVRAMFVAAAVLVFIAVAFTPPRSPDPQVGAEPLASTADFPRPVSPAPTAKPVEPSPSQGSENVPVCSPEPLPANENDCARIGDEDPMPGECPNAACVTSGSCGPQRN